MTLSRVLFEVGKHEGYDVGGNVDVVKRSYGSGLRVGLLWCEYCDVKGDVP